MFDHVLQGRILDAEMNEQLEGEGDEGRSDQHWVVRVRHSAGIGQRYVTVEWETLQGHGRMGATYCSSPSFAVMTAENIA